MLFLTDKYVAGMAGLRILSAAVEFTAAMVMLKLNRVDAALKVNAVLALVGPVILMVVTVLGIAGLAGKIPLHKMIWILIGAGLIFYGVGRE